MKILFLNRASYPHNSKIGDPDVIWSGKPVELNIGVRGRGRYRKCASCQDRASHTRSTVTVLTDIVRLSHKLSPIWFSTLIHSVRDRAGLKKYTYFRLFHFIWYQR